MKFASMLMFAAGLSAVPMIASADENKDRDFSTVTRVQYVMQCMESHPKMNVYESVHKCSCVVDEIDDVFTEVEYEDLNAGYMYKNLPADRGATFRDDKGLQKGWKLFDTTLANAYKDCRLR